MDFEWFVWNSNYLEWQLCLLVWWAGNKNNQLEPVSMILTVGPWVYRDVSRPCHHLFTLGDNPNTYMSIRLIIFVIQICISGIIKSKYKYKSRENTLYKYIPAKMYKSKNDYTIS